MVKIEEDATYIYVGEAPDDSATKDAVWKVKRTSKVDNRVFWADGNMNYDNSWDDYLTLKYLMDLEPLIIPKKLIKKGVGVLRSIPVDDYKISVKDAVNKAKLEDEDVEFMMMLLGDD